MHNLGRGYPRRKMNLCKFRMLRPNEKPEGHRECKISEKSVLVKS